MIGSKVSFREASYADRGRASPHKATIPMIIAVFTVKPDDPTTPRNPFYVISILCLTQDIQSLYNPDPDMNRISTSSTRRTSAIIQFNPQSPRETSVTALATRYDGLV